MSLRNNSNSAVFELYARSSARNVGALAFGVTGQANRRKQSVVWRTSESLTPLLNVCGTALREIAPRNRAISSTRRRRSGNTIYRATWSPSIMNRRCFRQSACLTSSSVYAKKTTTTTNIWDYNSVNGRSRKLSILYLMMIFSAL